MIAFIGSVFSPYYAAARRRNPSADPENHVAMNIALYGVRGPGWAMTERRRASLVRDPLTLSIGPSQMRWHDGNLVVRLDEISVPLPRRLRGTITLRPSCRLDQPTTLDPSGLHRWTPIAPCARVTVDLERPDWHWSGHGYLDSNDGDAPLEDAFSAWLWSRATLADASTLVLYDATGRDGSNLTLARRFHPDGQVDILPMPPRHDLPRGAWGVRRATHADAATLTRSLEDSPFYTRSLVRTNLQGHPTVAVHESLSLDRFRKPWVRALLPFRMPRYWR